MCRVSSHKFGVSSHKFRVVLWLLENHSQKCRKWLQRCGTAVEDKEGWQKHSIENISEVRTCTLFPSGSTPSNLLEPSRTTSVQRKKGV